MSDTPNRIWVDLKRALKTLDVRDKPPKQAMCECRDEYVRKDIADELAEALESIVSIPNSEAAQGIMKVYAKAALAKYKETKT